ncbi:MAG: hypothetical protein R8K53_01635 [Mariprofundaceae bacterium]
MNTSSPWASRILAGMLLAAMIYMFFPNGSHPRPDFWNIQLAPAYTSVLGLRLNEAQLKDAMGALKSKPDVALFTHRQRQNEPVPGMHLEAYFDDLFDEGDRIILALADDDQLLQQIKKQAYKPELLPNDNIRVGIRDEWMDSIRHLRIRNITIIVGDNMDVTTFATKFGKPGQQIVDAQGNTHMLYPALGLDFIQSLEGMQVLQFVSLDRFESELIAPLLQANKQTGLKHD